VQRSAVVTVLRREKPSMRVSFWIIMRDRGYDLRQLLMRNYSRKTEMGRLSVDHGCYAQIMRWRFPFAFGQKLELVMIAAGHAICRWSKQNSL
jgi:hypothetical protein